MSAIFSYFLELNMVASIIIVAIILLRFLFRNRISVHFHYVLWALLLIKLCIPIEVSSPLSAFQFVNKQETTNVVMNQLTPNLQQQERTEIPITNIENIAQTNEKNTAENIADTSEKKSAIPLINIIVTIWLTVIVLLLCLIGATIISTKRKLKNSMYHPSINELTMECKRTLKIKRKISVICSPYYRTPFVFGIFKPVVVIPYHLMETLDNEQVRFIFMHEFVHLKRFDYLFRQLMVINTVIHWYNPFIWLATYCMSEDCEKSCDATVVKYTKKEKAYASTLIDVAEFSSKRISTMYGLSFSKNHVKGRISQIMSVKRYKKRTLFFGIVIALVLAIGLLTTKKQVTSKDLMDFVQYPKTTVVLYEQKIKNGTLFFYKDETGFRQLFLSGIFKIHGGGSIEIIPQEGVVFLINNNLKASISTFSGMVTNDDIQSIIVKQGTEEKEATILETKEGRIWFMYFDGLDEANQSVTPQVKALSKDGNVVWDYGSDAPNVATVNNFSLTKEEQDVYTIFSKDLNEEHLAKLEPISIAKLYVQAKLDKRYDVGYALYTDRQEYVQWSKEQDEKMPERDRGTREQILQQFVNIDQGKFIQTDAISGYIQYPRFNSEGLSEEAMQEFQMMGFNMIKDEDGIWNVAFMPIQ